MNPFSRQYHILSNSIESLHESNVLIVGLRGLGVEVLRHLMLNGIGSVALLDPELISSEETSYNYYLTQADISLPRDSAILSKFSHQSKTKLSVVSSLNESSRYNLVISTLPSLSSSISLNNLTRSLSTSFISSSIHGLLTSIFVDRPNGTEYVPPSHWGYIQYISSSIVSTSNPHNLNTNDRILLSIKELPSLNKEYMINVIDKVTFSIDIDSNITYSGNGIFRYIPPSQSFSFKPLSEALENITDITTMNGHSIELHCCYIGYMQYLEKNNKRPLLEADFEEVLHYCRNIAEKFNTEINTTELFIFLKGLNIDLPPITSFWGGITAHEAIKCLTNRFIPIHQFLYFDFFSLSDILFNLSIRNVLSELSVFIVGLGACGSEVLKNLVLLGMNRFYLFDNDSVKLCDVSRNSLLSEDDIGKLKLKSISDHLLKYKPSLRFILFDTDNLNENKYFNDDFWSSLHYIFSCIDSDTFQMYLADKALFHLKYLIDVKSRYAGSKIGIMIPKYSDILERDPPSPTYMTCVIENFPYQPEHVVTFAYEQFQEYFINLFDNVNNYLSKGSLFLKELGQNPATQMGILESIRNSLVNEKPLSFDACIQYARILFGKLFNHRIKILLYNKPADTRTESGALWWSGCNKLPHPIDFNEEDPLHLQFVIAAANLRAYAYGLHGHSDIDKFQSVLRSTIVPQVQLVRTVILTADDEKNGVSTPSNELCAEDSLASLIESLPKPETLSGYKLNSISLSHLDDYSNYILSLLSSLTNLRCRNYDIDEISSLDVQLLLNQMHPQISTAISVSAGLSCVEFLKTLSANPGYNNTYKIDLNSNSYEIAPPAEVKKTTVRMKSKDYTWSCWDKLDIVGNEKMTLKDFLNSFKNQFGWEIDMLSYGVSLLFSCLGRSKHLDKPILQVIKDVAKKNVTGKYIILQAVVCDENGDDVEIPTVRLIM